MICTIERQGENREPRAKAANLKPQACIFRKFSTIFFPSLVSTLSG